MAIADPRWLITASQVINSTTNWQQTDFYAVGISPGTWGRFLGGKESIKAPAFKAYCQVLWLNRQEVCQPTFNKSLSDKPFYIERQPYLIIVHSTEVYGALDINHSPLGGVGLIVKLSEFSFAQGKKLASKY